MRSASAPFRWCQKKLLEPRRPGIVAVFQHQHSCRRNGSAITAAMMTTHINTIAAPNGYGAAAGYGRRRMLSSSPLPPRRDINRYL
jgi:hypothetical protein